MFVQRDAANFSEVITSGQQPDDRGWHAICLSNCSLTRYR